MWSPNMALVEQWCRDGLVPALLDFYQRETRTAVQSCLVVENARINMFSTLLHTLDPAAPDEAVVTLEDAQTRFDNLLAKQVYPKQAQDRLLRLAKTCGTKDNFHDHKCSLMCLKF